MEERFTYDNLNRLETMALNGGTPDRIEYDAFGRILSKQSDGNVVFDNPVYDDANKPHAIRSAQTYGDPFPTAQQNITYTMFDKVKTITQSCNGQQQSLVYTYGYDRQRIHMEEKLGNYTLREKRYGDHCEIVTENRHTVSRTYLSGPMGVFAVVEHNGEDDEIHYVYKDHLGSWTTITNAGGVVEREQSFDAWGNMRDPETWSGDYDNTLMFDRGFTGHEHLYGFGLINMNGRMYDPTMSSFLSVDNFVQAPDFSQSFNRYSYCLNNPLKFVDPSGWQMVPGLLRKPETRTYTPPGPLVQVQSDLNWWLTMAGADMLSGGLFSSSAFVLGTSSYFLNFPNTEAGYDLQKTISPLAFKLNYGFGSRNHIGVDVSLGLPGLNSYRWHCGASYYFGGNPYGNYNGWETRTGSEIRIIGVLSYSGTKFTAGSYSQITNKVSLQAAPYLRISYENDFMFDISLLGRYNADNGDRWRSAAVRINWGGVLEIGTNLFTGDPGKYDRDDDAKTVYDEDWNPHSYYIRHDALNADQRAGVLYVGFGNLRLGRNSESIRHAFQNRFAHDRLTKGRALWFLPLDIEPSSYFYYGTGTGDTLW